MSSDANNFTLLVISDNEPAPYSARGLTQTYEPIAASQHLERSVNGRMINLSASQMKLYKTKISCTDQNVPALSGVWPGDIVTLQCVEEMSFPTISPELQERDAVEGSMRIVGSYTFYRPILQVMFMGHSTSGEEYSRNVAWSMEFEEVGE